MKKFLAMICAAAMAVMCAVPAFAEATPGQVANEKFVAVADAKTLPEAQDAARDLAAYITANPDTELSDEMVTALSNVIDASGTEVNRVNKSDTVSNNIVFWSEDANNVSVQSLTREDGNTLVLKAEAPGGVAMGVKMAVSGLENGVYQLVYVNNEGNRTIYNRNVVCTNGVAEFVIPHFSTYEIVKVAGAASSSSSTASTTTVTASNAAAVDAEFYTCPACGYHDWTGTEGGYKCDHCGHIEAKDLSSYPNVKGTATLPTTTASAAAASGKIIKATGADMSLVILAVLAVAAVTVAGFACVVRKQGLGK